jgi:hypothetical protein
MAPAGYEALWNPQTAPPRRKHGQGTLRTRALVRALPAWGFRRKWRTNARPVRGSEGLRAVLLGALDESALQGL